MAQTRLPDAPALISPAISLNRAILTLAIPAVVENLLQTVVFFSDTVMIGWIRDPAALAAVGLSGTLFYLLMTLFGALAVSATALVARAWGAGDRPRAEMVAAQSLLLCGVLSLVGTLLLLPFAPDYLRLMGGDADVVAQGTQFIRIVLWSSVFNFPMMVANGIMRGAGDTRTPMWNTLVMNCWNIVVSYTLIFGAFGFPALGLVGAAIGTTTARGVGGILAVGALLGGRTPLRIHWRALLRWDGQMARRVLQLAIPTAIEGSIAQSGFILFTRMVASLGTATLAAHQIALRVESLSYMPAWGLAAAATTIVGQALGAGRMERAEASIRRTILFSIGFNLLLGLVFVLFSRSIVSIFGSTPEVLSLAALAVAISAAELLGIGIEMILAGGMRGAGDTRTPMYVTIAGVLLLRLPVVYLLAITLGWGLAGVWWGTAIDWTGRTILLWLLFRRGRWKTLRLEE
ncbi:MAG: MATE family efflux transporter [Chloroflexi bacterium]|nr:MAG: MATE family efflux transporter [Chloroflexota bacterium]